MSLVHPATRDVPADPRQVGQDDIQNNNAFDHDGLGILRYIYINDTHHFWTKRKKVDQK